MKAACARAAVVFGVLAVAAVPSRLNATLMSERVRDVTFEVERSPGAQATYAACAEVVRMLGQRGWDAESVRVRIQGNPFDATASVADVVLGTGEPSEDSAFILASTIVERQLRRSTDASTARILAQSVAAHGSPSSANRLPGARLLSRLGRGHHDNRTTRRWRRRGRRMRRAAGSLPGRRSRRSPAGVESVAGYGRSLSRSSDPRRSLPPTAGSGLAASSRSKLGRPVCRRRVEAWVAVRYSGGSTWSA
jgi:hypothetical protein